MVIIMISVLLLDLFRGRRLRFAAVRLVNITDNDVDCFPKCHRSRVNLNHLLS